MNLASGLAKFKKTSFYNVVSNNLHLIEILLIPLVFSPIPIVIQTQVAYCFYIILVIASYWIAECLPIGITSALPVFLLPVFGIEKSQNVAMNYFKDTVMFIFASLVIGLGIETSGLHEKLALRFCMFLGSDPVWLLLGIMSITGFLSIWISNTATTSMILPIVVSLVREVVKINPKFQPTKEESETRRHSQHFKHQHIEMNGITKENKSSEDEESSKNDEENEMSDKNSLASFKSESGKKLIKGFCLAITYSATIGGTASLIGTSSNISFKNYFETEHKEDSMNFITFMAYSFPLSVILTITCWLTMCIIWLPNGFFSLMHSIKNSCMKLGACFRRKKIAAEDEDTENKEIDALAILIKKNYDELGPYTWEQISIGVWFCVAVVSWITRDLFYVPGWSYFFKKDYVTDTSSAIFVLFCICSWPKKNIFKGHKYEPLLTWKQIERQFPWTIIFLVGGSLAIADGCDKSGFKDWFGSILRGIIPKNKYIALLVVSIFSMIGTEFMSNVSMVLIMLPILDQLAVSNQIEFHYMLLPQAIAVNFSYMLPAASPSNAIVFGTNYLTLKDMLLTGLILKVIGLCVLFLGSNTWLLLIFDEIKTDNNATSAIFKPTTLDSAALSTMLP